MPACKYPQKRNSKTGRCKKPCKKTQKVSKSTGRCISKRRPSTRKKRRTRRPRRTCKALYYDNYIPDYIGDIGYDTEEETPTPLVQKAVQTFKNLLGLEESREEAISKRKQEEEKAAESILNRDTDEFQDAVQEEPVEPVEPEVIPEFDIIPPQLSKPGVEIFKGVSSAAHSLQKNVYGLFKLQEDYNCSPSSDISQENVSSNNEDCGIVEVGMAEQDDFNDSWVKRISTQTGEIGYMTMYGQKFDSKALMWVLTRQNLKHGFFDCVFLFEKHLWRIQAKGKLPLEINMEYIATEFDRILEEGNDVEQKVFDFFYGGVDVSKIEYAGNTQVLPRKSTHVSEFPFKKLALVSLTAFAATNAPDVTSNPLDEPVILNDEGLVEGAEVPESVTQGLIGESLPDDDTVRRPTNSDLNQPFIDGLVNNLHQGQGPQGMIGQTTPSPMIANSPPPLIY